MPEWNPNILRATYRHYSSRLIRDFRGLRAIALKQQLNDDREKEYVLYVGAANQEALNGLPRSVDAVDDKGTPTGDVLPVQPAIHPKIVARVLTEPLLAKNLPRPVGGGASLGRWLPHDTEDSCKDHPQQILGDYRFGGGTFGGLVWNGQTPYMVTNNHAMMNPFGGTACPFAKGKHGDLVFQAAAQNSGTYQPGAGNPDDAGLESIGTIVYWVPIVPGPYEDARNYVDLALVEPHEKWRDHVKADVAIIGKPTGTASVTQGDEVRQVGAGTDGMASGEVTNALGSGSYYVVYVDGDAEAGILEVGAWFRDTIEYDATTQQGDSGALLFDDQDRVVGLHFAGTESGSHSYANRIDRVIEELGTGQTVMQRDEIGISWTTKQSVSFVEPQVVAIEPDPEEDNGNNGGNNGGPCLLWAIGLLAVPVVLLALLLT